MELRGLGDAGVARPLTPAGAGKPAPRPTAADLAMTSPGITKLAVAGLAALTLVRLTVAATTPLSPDEIYYWVWSRALAAGYVDHPPMVALWIRAGTTLAGNAALGVRLLAPLAAAAGSWLLWNAAERLLSRQNAGVIAAALLNATLVLGAGAVIMTPDTPLLFFWVCTLWALARLCPADANPAWWLAVGLFAGLAFDSKYTGVFLAPGIGLWLLLAGRPWLRRPWPWLGGAVGLLLIAPVLAWNAAHEWVSFARQGGRVGAWHPARAAQFLAEFIGGQLGLATPLVALLCAAGLVLAWRKTWRERAPGWTLLLSLSLPPLAVFVQHAFADRVQANWPAVVYPAAVIAAAGLEAQAWRRWYWPAVGLGLAIVLTVYLQTATSLFPVPPRFDPLTLQLAGWPALAEQIEAVRQREGASFVAVSQYGTASELAYRLPGDAPVVGDDRRWRMFALPPEALDGKVGILVRNGASDESINTGPWAAQQPIAVLTRQTDGKTPGSYYLYRVIGSEALRDIILLPRRP
jgi:4-amino-4-deoxy-L-arabinose transferase-like glycosyltransferase